MNFTYTNPSESVKDYIRLKLGDTVKTKYSLFDEEIQSIVDMNPSKNKALIECCEAILAKLAKQVDYTIGPEKVAMSDAYTNYANLLDRLKNSNTILSMPIAKVGKPCFTIGMHDNV